MSDTTPRPWALHSKASLARILGVAQFVHAADAELACRAVNAHDGLVAALESAEDWMDRNVPSDGWGILDKRENGDREVILASVRDALRLAGKT
jgi:hypothetical protein